MRSETTKKVIIILLAIGLLLGLLLPTFALGQTERPVCERFASFKTRSDAQATKRKDKFSQQLEARAEKLTDRRDARAERIEAHRVKFDQVLAEHIARLNARATNAEQAAAVAEFEKAVKEAMAKRRAAVSAAHQAFIKGVQDAVTARRQALAASATTYYSAIGTAIDQAVANCDAGTDPSTVKSELQTAIRSAKEDFREARASTAKVGPNVSELTKVRREAVQKARDEFKATVEAARDKLKEILGVRAE